MSSKREMQVMALLSSYSLMADTRLRYPTLHGTNTSHGSSLAWQKITLFRCGRWLRVFTLMMTFLLVTN